MIGKPQLVIQKYVESKIFKYYICLIYKQNTFITMYIDRDNIIKELELVPQERLNEVDAFIRFIIAQTMPEKRKKRKKEPKTLAGIWKNKGFENIADIDTSIKSARKTLAANILKKHGK